MTESDSDLDVEESNCGRRSIFLDPREILGLFPSHFVFSFPSQISYSILGETVSTPSKPLLFDSVSRYHISSLVRPVSSAEKLDRESGRP